ncbi:MAG: hypothetical protein ACP5HK_04980 [Acidilobus sp.]
MRWWLGAAIVYIAFMSSALALAVAPYVHSPARGLLANTSLQLVWFDPDNVSVDAFVGPNGTLVQFAKSAYWLPVRARAACGLGDEIAIAGQYSGMPALVLASPRSDVATVVDVNGTLTTVACRPALAAAGVAQGFLSSPYRPIVLTAEQALVLNATVLLEPSWAYGSGGSYYVAFGTNYYLVVNSSGAYVAEAPDSVEIYVVEGGILAGQYTSNQSAWPFLTVTDDDLTYLFMTTGYVQLASRSLDGWDLYIRPPSGWATLLYVTSTGPSAVTSAVFDLPFSLGQAYPYEGGVEVLGTLYPSSGVREQVGVYINGTSQGYLEEDGQVVGWTAMSRPAALLPSSLAERPPYSLTYVTAASERLRVNELILRPEPTPPVHVAKLDLQENLYDRALSYSIMAAIVATAVVAFVRKL